jgi:hypothetical protein
MNRHETLVTAAAAINGPRNTTYGPPEDNFRQIAELWSCHLGRNVYATDVAIMMILLKVARLRANPTHEDSWVDIAGYAACGAELNDVPEARDVCINDPHMEDMGDA